MNLAFLFLTYDDILHDETKQFVKNYSVYVNAKNPSKIQRHREYELTSYPTDWGKKNIVDATLQMLKSAYSKGHTWYILLAYDTLPLVTPSVLESFLRYQTKSMFHLIENTETIWKTSQWWILSKADVETILSNYETYDQYLETHPYSNKKNANKKKQMGAWDELYFLSLLKYVNPAYIFRDHKTTYVQWLTGYTQKHPVTFGKLLETDLEDSKKSFFIRKTTPSLTLKPHTPHKILYIKVFGDKTPDDSTPEGDLMLISLLSNDKIPPAMLNKSIHTYFTFWEYLNVTILELLNTIPTYLWNKIIILSEESNQVIHSPDRTSKISLRGIPPSIPNPPQFYKFQDSYEYSPNKIAFLFLTIGDINQPHLWTQYFDKKQDKYNVYINPKYPEMIETKWLKNKIIKKRVQNTGWGFITEAYHNLLEEAMQDPDNVKFVFISESCVPLKSFDAFYHSMMLDDLRTSYVKFMNISAYDMKERIKTQPGYEEQGRFIKHYARMCLSRYHVSKLLSKDFGFFNRMHVGDEFFLTLLHPSPGKDYMKDFEITYDNWEDVSKKTTELSNEIRSIYNKYPLNSSMSENNQNAIRRKRAIRNEIAKNPKTYTSITTEDIERALRKESFFWRKFTSEPLPWTPELLNIVSVNQPVKKPPIINTLKTRKERNTKTRKVSNSGQASQTGISI